MDSYVEVFYSKPMWKRCYLIERTPYGTWETPHEDRQFVDASHIRDAFRVLRMEAPAEGSPLEFAVTDGKNRIDSNHGKGYKISCSGRFILEHGGRRVGDENVMECRQAVRYPKDRFVALTFTNNERWTKASVIVSIDGGAWDDEPGREMMKNGSGFLIQLQGSRLEFAFTDGVNWDSNESRNYRVGTPGHYKVGGGILERCGRAPADERADQERIKSLICGWKDATEWKEVEKKKVLFEVVPKVSTKAQSQAPTQEEVEEKVVQSKDSKGVKKSEISNVGNGKKVGNKPSLNLP